MVGAESQQKRSDKSNGKFPASNNVWIALGQRIMGEVPVIRGAPLSFLVFSIVLSGVAVLLFWWLNILEPALISTSLRGQIELLKTEVSVLRGTADNKMVLEGVWPALSSDQIESLEARLKQIDKTELVVSCSELSCRPLAISFLNAFQSSGWANTRGSPGGIESIGIDGIAIYPIDARANQIKEAIEAATGLQITVPENEARGANNDGPIVISVGLRPLKVN
jgi:hypothetical protein